MSSSAESELDATPPAPTAAIRPLSWADFPERAIPQSSGELVSPESELTGLARRYEEELAASRKDAADAAGSVREALFDLAVFVGRFAQLTSEVREALIAQGHANLHGRFSVLCNQLTDVLVKEGVKIVDPTGLPAAEVMDWIEVRGWVQRAEYEDEVVARTEECAVFHEGRPVRFAAVQMGAPLLQPADEDEPDAASEQGTVEEN